MVTIVVRECKVRRWKRMMDGMVYRLGREGRMVRNRLMWMACSLPKSREMPGPGGYDQRPGLDLGPW